VKRVLHQGQTITLNVEPSDTMRLVKEKISEKLKIPCDDQCLTSATKPMVDRRTLAAYAVEPWSTLDLSLRVCGGGKPCEVSR
jgi:hypothetical protein